MLKYLNSYIKADLLGMVPDTFHGPLFTDSNPYLRNFIHWNNELKESRTSLKHKKTESNLFPKVEAEKLGLVLKLIRAGADPDKRFRYGPTGALMVTANNGRREMVKILLEHKADPNLQQTNRYMSALISASSYGDFKIIIKILLEYNADTDLRSCCGRPVLISASIKGFTEIVKMLLKHNADPNQQTDECMSPLMLAIAINNKEMVEILLANKTDPNLQFDNGLTALIMASSRGHIKIVKMLSAKGADPDLRNLHGQTALGIARNKGHAEIVNMLEYVTN